MIAMSAADLAAAVGGRVVGDPERQVRRVVIDSRVVEPGDAFFAIVGERDDGHRYVPEAVAAGAGVVVVEDRELEDAAAAVAETDDATSAALVAAADTTIALQDLAAHVRVVLDPAVVAVTGSVGKTTTKDLIAALLAPRFSVHATPGNLNNHWGLPLSLLGLEPGHAVMVAELAMSGAGEIRRLARIARPSVGVITNVSPVHMQFFGSIDEVAAAKAELAEELPADGTLVVNADDPRTAVIGEGFVTEVGRVITFGATDRATVRAADLAADGDGWRLQVWIDELDPVPVRLSLAGRHSVSNFLAAAAVAWALGLAPPQIAAAAAALALPARRGGRRRLASGVVVIDESYNASPLAMRRALETLRDRPADRRRVAVLGDMLELGDRAESYHREVGELAAASRLDLLVAVGDLAAAVRESAIGAGMEPGSILSFDTAEEAGAALATMLQSGDMVLVKGSRALRMERVIEALAATEVAAAGRGGS